MAPDGGIPLPEPTPDELTPEMAPFVAQAQARVTRAIDGLDHDAAVAHLEDAVAQAAVQASRLGFSFPVAEPTDDLLALGDGSIVLVQRMGHPDRPD
jgi:hypothetical protein